MTHLAEFTDIFRIWKILGTSYIIYHPRLRQQPGPGPGRLGSGLGGGPGPGQLGSGLGANQGGGWGVLGRAGLVLAWEAMVEHTVHTLGNGQYYNLRHLKMPFLEFHRLICIYIYIYIYILGVCCPWLTMQKSQLFPKQSLR